MLFPNIIPFLLKTGNWLEVLREERIKVKVKKNEDNDAFMKSVLKLMTKEQMKGYLSGLNKP